MTTPIFAFGAEIGAAFTVNGTGLANFISNVAIVSTEAHSGSYSIRTNPTSTLDSYCRWVLSTPNRLIGRHYFKIATAPTAALPIMDILCTTSTSHPRFYLNPTNGKIEIRTSSSTVVATGPSYVVGEWFYIDFDFNISGNPWQLKAKVNGGTEFSGTSPQNGDTFVNYRIGNPNSGAYDVYHDDIVLSVTPADYPIGPGGTQLLKPSADGSHNAGTNVIEDQAGNDIGAVTAYDKINSIPPNGTTYIKQVSGASGNGNYAEVLFEDITAPHSAIIGACAFLAYTSATTTSNKGACIVSKDNFASQTTVWGAPGSGNTADYSDGATNNLFYKRALINGVVDDNTVNALKARLGYSDDTTPNPYWVDLAIEVAYTTSTGPAPVQATITLVGENGSLAAEADVQVSSSLSLSGDGQLQAEADVFIDAEISGVGNGEVSAQAQVAVEGSIALSGDGVISITASVSDVRQATIALTGDGSLAAEADVLVSGSVALSGDGAVSGAGEVLVSGSVSLSGDGTVAGEAEVLVEGEVNLSGQGEVAAQGATLINAILSLSGEGQLAAQAAVYNEASVELSGDGQLQSSASVLVSAQLSGVGNGEIAIQANLPVIASAALEGDGTLSAQANALADAQVSLGGDGVIEMGAEALVDIAIALSGEGTVAATVTVVQPGSASINIGGGGEVSIAVATLVQGSLQLQGQGQLAAEADVEARGSIELSGSGELSALAHNQVDAQIALTGDGQVYAEVETGFDGRTAVIALSGEGSLSAQAAVHVAGAVELSGVGNVSSLAHTLVTASIDLTGEGSIRILIGVDIPESLDAIMRELSHQATMSEIGYSATMTSRDLIAQMSNDDIGVTVREHKLQSTLTEV